MWTFMLQACHHIQVGVLPENETRRMTNYNLFPPTHIHAANPNTGEWSTWSECTKSCGGGTRFRVRMCGGSNCASQQESCNTQDCDPEPNLRGEIGFNEGCIGPWQLLELILSIVIEMLASFPGLPQFLFFSLQQKSSKKWGRSGNTYHVGGHEVDIGEGGMVPNCALTWERVSWSLVHYWSIPPPPCPTLCRIHFGTRPHYAWKWLTLTD